MGSTAHVLYFHYEELLKKCIIISIYTFLFFPFLRNKEKKACFHLHLLFYSSELFIILNRIHNNNLLSPS